MNKSIAALGILVLFTACVNHGGNNPPEPAETLRLVIQIKKDTARTAVPDGAAFNVAKYTAELLSGVTSVDSVDGDGTGVLVIEDIDPAGLTDTVTVKVTGYNADDKKIVEGSTDVPKLSIIASLPVTVIVSPLTGGTGGVSLRVRFPDNITKAEAALYDALTGGAFIGADFAQQTLSTADGGKRNFTFLRSDVPSGIVYLKIKLYRDTTLVGSFTEAINIRDNVITNKWISEDSALVDYLDYTNGDLLPLADLVHANIRATIVTGYSLLSLDHPKTEVLSGSPVTIALSGGTADSGNVLLLDIDDSEVSVSGSALSNGYQFTAPSGAGYYSVSVVLNSDGVGYSGTFGLLVVSNATANMVLEGYSGGVVTVRYTDGTSDILAGSTLNIPATGKVIYSIEAEDLGEVLIGRKADGSPILLKFNNDELQLRNAVDGFVPIGSFAEFQCINLNADTRKASYLQEADLDLLGFLTDQNELLATVPTPLKRQNWSPIGTNSNYFQGNFDGNGFSIKNFYSNNVTGDYVGLFGQIWGYGNGNGDNATLANIHLDTGYLVSTANYVGGIAAGFSYGTLINSYNKATIMGTKNYIGGLVGQGDVTITSCYFAGKVTGEGSNTGGVIANGSGAITASYNTGEVTSSTGNSSTGGIAGYYSSGTMNNCYNAGIVTSTTGSTGGVIGSNNGTVTYSYNTGVVSGVSQLGGIVGYNTGTINSSHNEGEITGTDYNIGGIVGQMYSGEMADSYNTATIRGKSSVGGVIGGTNTSYNKKIIDSHNTGTVIGSVSGNGDSIGGIVGTGGTYPSSLTIMTSYNTGTVTGHENPSRTSNYVGGIAGNSATITACYNTGSITGTSRVGGIAGDSGTITATYNLGSVYGNNYVGGITGSTSGTLRANYWRDNDGDDAVYGRGSDTNNNPAATNEYAAVFNAVAWPDEGIEGWAISGANGFWSTLGSWNGGTPVFPKLWYQE